MAGKQSKKVASTDDHQCYGDTDSDDDNYLSWPVSNLVRQGGPLFRVPTPKYYGRDKMDLFTYQVFRFRFKCYLEYYEVAEEETYRAFIERGLKDQPLRWFIQYTNEHPDIVTSNYDTLIQILDTEYMPPWLVTHYKLAYQQIQRTSSESIEDFIDRMNRLVFAANLDPTDEDQKNKLCNNLPYNIRESLVPLVLDPNVKYQQFVHSVKSIYMLRRDRRKQRNKERNQMKYQQRQQQQQHLRHHQQQKRQ